MLQPKRTKHRKMEKGRMKSDAKRGATISFGSYALKALDQHWITDRQIEAARQAVTRDMKREGNVWIRILPDKPITRKPGFGKDGVERHLGNASVVQETGRPGHRRRLDCGTRRR